MSGRLANASLLAALIAIGGIALAAPDSAQSDAVRVYTMSPGRIEAILGNLIGLIGAVNGRRALARSANRAGGERRRRAVVALALGSAGILAGVLVVLTAKGGVGTGNGYGGGIVAITIGLIGLTLGGLALARR